MWRYLRVLWLYCTGRFSQASKLWMENPHVMEAAYDSAIAKAQSNFNATKEAVAEMVLIEQRQSAELKVKGQRVERLQNVKNGAQLAMQKRIDILRGQGKSKDDILLDPEFIKHQGAFNDASSSLIEVESQYQSLEEEIKNRKAQIAKYQEQLKETKRADDKLKTEKSEALADVAIAKQQEALNSMLSGIGDLSVDKDLKEAREAHARAKARSKVTSELVGADLQAAENEYVSYSRNNAVNNQLDSLLNWGDEPTSDKIEELTPAKLPEN